MGFTIKDSGVWTWIKRNPTHFTIIIFLMFFLFTTILFWLRLTGQTLLFPAFEKYVKIIPVESLHAISTEQLNKYSRIVGKYKYKCQSDVKNHGGTCTISVVPTDNGLQWRLEGERRWEEYKDSTGKLIKTKLNFPYLWTTAWGGFLADNRIGFSYEITTHLNHIKGYAEGDINSSDHISGRYWQLPPDNPLFGYFEFRRRVDDSDTEW